MPSAVATPHGKKHRKKVHQNNTRGVTLLAWIAPSSGIHGGGSAGLARLQSRGFTLPLCLPPQRM
jgi:hypothetical protein